MKSSAALSLWKYRFRNFIPEPDKKHSFTLIELLVVIAIIAILAAILLPALNKARSKAVTAQCLSNVKQCMSAQMSYANEHNEYFPHPLYVTASGNYEYWSKELVKLSYLPPVYSKRPHVAQCPLTTAMGLNVHINSYGIVHNYSKVASGETYVSLKAIKKPSLQAWIVDVYKTHAVAGGLEFLPDVTNWAFFDRKPEVNMWHDDRANIAFVDGHAETLGPVALWARVRQTTVKNQLFFFRNGENGGLTIQ